MELGACSPLSKLQYKYFIRCIKVWATCFCELNTVTAQRIQKCLISPRRQFSDLFKSPRISRTKLQTLWRSRYQAWSCFMTLRAQWNSGCQACNSIAKGKLGRRRRTFRQFRVKWVILFLVPHLHSHVSNHMMRFELLWSHKKTQKRAAFTLKSRNWFKWQKFVLVLL